jgi:chromosome segregation ATPase
MINKTIQHSFRKISFDWDESIPETDHDKELLSAFLQLHDAAKTQKDLGIEITKDCQKIEKETENLKLQLDEIKDLIAKLNGQADELTVGFTAHKQGEYEKLIQESKPVQKKISEHNAQLNKLYKELEKSRNQQEEFKANDEDFSLWEKYSSIQSKHYNNYQNNSIDIKTFDEEDNRFKTFVEAVSGNKDWIINFGEKVILNYNLLVAQTTTQQEIWSEFKKRLVLIHRLIESSTEINDISAN